MKTNMAPERMKQAAPMILIYHHSRPIIRMNSKMRKTWAVLSEE